MMFYVSSQDCFTNIKTVILERMVEKTRGPGENLFGGNGGENQRALRKPPNLAS